MTTDASDANAQWKSIVRSKIEEVDGETRAQLLSSFLQSPGVQPVFRRQPAPKMLAYGSVRQTTAASPPNFPTLPTLRLTSAEADQLERDCAPELMLSGAGLSTKEKKKLLVQMVRVSSLDDDAQAKPVPREHLCRRADCAKSALLSV